MGCIAGVHIGSSMGATVEGWSYQRIEETYGTVDKLRPTSTMVMDGSERPVLLKTALRDRNDDHGHNREEGQGQCRGRTKDLAQGYKAGVSGHGFRTL